MREPTFLLQAGGPLPTEKIACSFSTYPVQYCKYESIRELNPKEALTKFIPVGSVEFAKEYADHVGFQLPDSFTYEFDLDKFFMRSIRRGTYGEASLTEFVKPTAIKSFTGNIKGHLEAEAPGVIPPDSNVWISEPVPFGAEFRFYIHSFVSGGKILGWSRYDDSNQDSYGPDEDLVEDIIKQVDYCGSPGAYSIDIGWRPDLNRYCLVEVNDAWSLGLYENTDKYSNPPTRQQYADMLVSRWTQIVFCAILDSSALVRTTKSTKLNY